MDEADDIGSFTELGERLTGPGGADVAAEVVGRIDALLHSLRVEVAAGVPFGRFEAFNSLERSLVAARRVVLLMQSSGAETTGP
ncbi:hypothetical protein [Antarcticirhabdus aurantiaca]|uniref:Uncharacterized protein n=1 Tax=Antarcticirhabdus aurantiaca TaxID=2606717 RepID=A0ACD4NUV9_9HYPH|nr:hypothetical protein [Antarcticirhabdus aurantiaca]WAJ30491.1 hypothetical protein OXU80_09930 [Jeongeuplla avenae]